MSTLEELNEAYEAAKMQTDRAGEILGEAQALFIAAENCLKARKVKEARAFNELTACMRSVEGKG